MVAVDVTGDHRLTDGGVWFRMEELGRVSAARRSAELLAGQMGFDTERVGALAIVVTELASNLVKHADDGLLLIRPARAGKVAGVEVLAVDSGPGMDNVLSSARDGYSTAGTLGIGLGAISRQASWVDVFSMSGKGTVTAVQVWPAEPPELYWAAGVSRPMTGEKACGDGFAVRVVDGRRQVLVCDGLGHGPLAAAAAAATVHAFQVAPAVRPAAVIEHLHRSVSHTRGAAAAVAELDLEAGLVRYAGLGNITGTLMDGPDRRGLVSLPGIVGHQRRTVREFDYPMPAGACLVMHTDGVTDRWRLADYPGLQRRSPQVIAGTMLRDAAVRRDDACVLVARTTP
ncbi:ATP-binding protein [Micromonospora polyrhachis]|uniref:Anti-sigma regulatory factor (Ser/Thr protein kinase) n=1 Tax=Micromonospora polyrhachis TaxID=1282883 RepID=A0A7W7SP80_9ACTN|nr:SpoIIE family protein phosphatase [Micromonospora polyrhachis]MBB4958439.1 anti-sigma regulatory factor (Ser/Thr protein kinase) [Micromonospora polyrhachis]